MSVIIAVLVTIYAINTLNNKVRFMAIIGATALCAVNLSLLTVPFAIMAFKAYECQQKNSTASSLDS